MLDALSPQRRRFVLGVIALGLAVVLAVVGTTLTRAISARVTPVAQNAPGPVLLVPGYGGTGASLTPLATALSSAGRDVVIVRPLGDGTGDLGDQARHLGTEVDRVLAQTGASSVDVVGYSAGGVVARAWVRDDGGGRQARRVVSLGSPQHGSSQAALGAELAGECPPACEQLVPDSDLLRQLNAGDETPRGPLWATLRSSTDEVVTPVDSAELDGAVNVLIQDVCPSATPGHSDLPADPVVIAALGTLLGTAPPAAPTDVTC